MSEESIQVIQSGWRRSKGTGAVLGTMFNRNLLSINAQLLPVSSGGLQSQHDQLLNELLDEVIDALNDQAKLMAALTKLRGMFWFGNNGERPFDDIGTAILMTLEQVMADDFTSKIESARFAVEERLSELKKKRVNWAANSFYVTWSQEKHTPTNASAPQILESVYSTMLKKQGQD